MQYFTWLIIHKVAGKSGNTVIMLMMKVIERGREREKRIEEELVRSSNVVMSLYARCPLVCVCVFVVSSWPIFILGRLC